MEFGRKIVKILLTSHASFGRRLLFDVMAIAGRRRNVFNGQRRHDEQADAVQSHRRALTPRAGPGNPPNSLDHRGRPEALLTGAHRSSLA